MHHYYRRQEASSHEFRGTSAEGVEYDVKIVISNVENYESSTVDNHVRFEIPPGEVRFLTKALFRVGIGFSLTKAVLNPTTGWWTAGQGQIHTMSIFEASMEMSQ